ncbi:MAG: hypothetical protein OJF59_003235 [Cytophagales bacterium]|nr:MAG: hypothetical protein OJF59_003235 [Cytophagales bacterium]
MLILLEREAIQDRFPFSFALSPRYSQTKKYSSAVAQNKKGSSYG